MAKVKYASYNNLILAFLSTILGCVITNIWIKQSYDVSAFDLSSIKVFTISTQRHILFGNILLKRMEQMAVIILAIRVFRFERVVKFLFSVFGLTFGFLLTVQSYYQGMIGIMFIVFVISPAFVLYYYALIFLKDSIRKSEDIAFKVQFIMLSILFFVVGIIYESIFSEKIFMYFYQYMVTV